MTGNDRSYAPPKALAQNRAEHLDDLTTALWHVLQVRGQDLTVKAFLDVVYMDDPGRIRVTIDDLVAHLATLKDFELERREGQYTKARLVR